MIQEYRKRTAEFLELKQVKYEPGALLRIYESQDGYTRYDPWHPDLDANQMEMVEDKLVNLAITIEYVITMHDCHCILKDYRRMYEDYGGVKKPTIIDAVNKSKKLAFAEAFMQIPEELLKPKP